MSTPFKFFQPVKIRYQDTDQQGVVYFGQYFSFLDEGVEGYLAAIGYNYQEMLAEKVDFVYAEANCGYKSPSKWPEVVNVHTRIGSIGNRSLRFEFELIAAADDRLVATGFIAAVTVDSTTYKPTLVPDRLRQAVERYESDSPL